jgi:CHASE3 domain sensor protein
MTYTTKIITGFGMVLVALSMLGVLSYLSVVQNDHDRGWLIHTHLVIEQLDLALSNLLDAETDLRDYIMTGDESYADPFRDAVGQVNENIAKCVH